MKHDSLLLAGVLGALSLSAVAETKITEKMKDSDEDTSVLIQRKTGTNFERAFENVTDTQTITGETVGGKTAAKASWTKECNTWKKETRDHYQTVGADSKILFLSCGKADLIKDPSNNGDAYYESEGKVTVRTRVTDKR